MDGFLQFLGRLVRTTLRLILGLALAVVVLSLLLLALLWVLGTSLWAVLRGRKPTPVLVFQHIRRASQRYTSAAWPGRAGSGGRAAAADDVVDVQAHEVHDAPVSPPAARPGPLARLP